MYSDIRRRQRRGAGPQRGGPHIHAGKCGLFHTLTGRLCQHTLQGRNPAPKAARQMKMTAADLKQKSIVDEIVKEPLGGASGNIDVTVRRIRNLLNRDLSLLTGKKMKNLLEERYEKYRRIGVM